VGITNSKPPGPIIVIGESKTGSSSQIVFITLFLADAQLCCAFYQPQQTKQICRRKTIFLSKTGICLPFLHMIVMCRSHTENRWGCSYPLRNSKALKIPCQIISLTDLLLWCVFIPNIFGHHFWPGLPPFNFRVKAQATSFTKLKKLSKDLLLFIWCFCFSCDTRIHVSSGYHMNEGKNKIEIRFKCLVLGLILKWSSGSQPDQLSPDQRIGG